MIKSTMAKKMTVKKSKNQLSSAKKAPGVVKTVTKRSKNIARKVMK